MRKLTYAKAKYAKARCAKANRANSKCAKANDARYADAKCAKYATDTCLHMQQCVQYATLKYTMSVIRVLLE